jgi:hypothetical protein
VLEHVNFASTQLEGASCPSPLASLLSRSFSTRARSFALRSSCKGSPATPPHPLALDRLSRPPHVSEADIQGILATEGADNRAPSRHPQSQQLQQSGRRGTTHAATSRWGWFSRLQQPCTVSRSCPDTRTPPQPPLSTRRICGCLGSPRTGPSAPLWMKSPEHQHPAR